MGKVSEYLSDGNGGAMELRRKIISSENPT